MRRIPLLSEYRIDRSRVGHIPPIDARPIVPFPAIGSVGISVIVVLAAWKHCLELRFGSQSFIPSSLTTMLLLSILIWYFRRTEPITLSDVKRCVAIVMLVVCMVPGDLAGGASCQAKDAEPPSETQLLREGTRIPPTTGRIVMVGRRWAFIPIVQSDESEAVASRYPSVTRALMIGELKRRATRLGSSGRDYGRNRFQSVSAPMEELANPLPLGVEQITLQENLMLQRIVKSIRIDANDDHWIVSGEITEFFNENRLLIQVAQRANRH